MVKIKEIVTKGTYFSLQIYVTRQPMMNLERMIGTFYNSTRQLFMQVYIHSLKDMSTPTKVERLTTLIDGKGK